MLFQELNKIKRSSIIMSIALMALGLVMAMCPEKYINSLIFSCVLFLGSCILATADIAPKTRYGIPLLASIGIIFSVALGIFTVRKMIKKK